MLGVTSQLSVDDADLNVFSDGTFGSFGTGQSYNPLSPLFGGRLVVTTEDGLAYQIDGSTGDINLVGDANGNTLTFTDDAITSSTGEKVTFERDAQGRIIAVIDPNEARVEYAYDASGDLTSVKDREGNATTFIYNEPSRDHFLTEIRDPLGRTGIRSEYDDAGRLVKTFDANGEVIQFIHDPDNFTETIVDQLGNRTVFEYDEFGNVVAEVDAAGGITRRTYEDPNNPTLESSITDALGNTTTFEYDDFGQLTSTTDPLGNVTVSTHQRFTFEPSLGNLYSGLIGTKPFSRETSSIDASGNTTVSNYDSRGNLLSTTNPDGTQTRVSSDGSGNLIDLSIGSDSLQFDYNSAGNVVSQKDAAGTERLFTYDEVGNRLTETVVFTTVLGPSTIVTTNEYDKNGRITRAKTEQDGVLLTQSSTEYNSVGNPTSQTDGNGVITRFEYDNRGLLTRTIFPDGTPADDSDNPTTEIQYDAAGNIVAQIDELRRVTRFQYDSVGRQTFTILPDDTPTNPDDNPRIETVYDLAGRIVAETDSLGNTTRFEYDSSGNQVATIFADNTPDESDDNPRVIDAYDELGRRISTTDPLGVVTEFDYSAGGFLTETKFADGTSTSNQLDDEQQFVGRTDQNGFTTGYEYDELGRLAAVIETVAGVDQRTEYQYDELGNLIQQIDANGNSTAFEYDGLGRRIATILPLLQRSTTAYDLSSNVVSSTDFNGRTTTYEYDPRNRLTLKTLPSGDSVEYSYTATGARSTVVDSRGTTSYVYDELDRLISKTDPDGSAIGYAYDAGGNRISVTSTIDSTSHTTSYTFNALNQIQTVTDHNADTTSYVYDQAGRLVRTAFANGLAELRQYNDLGRLTSIDTRNVNTDAILAEFQYEYNNVGDRTSVSELDGRRVEYVYDVLNRLTEEAIFNSSSTTADQTISYTYDPVGNRLERNDSSNGVTNYSYNANDLLTNETSSGSTATAYTYDANGNTLSKDSDGRGVVYEWDAENRLVGVDADGDGSNDVSYEYDVDGIRVSRTEGGEKTNFLIDSNRPYAQVLEEFTAGGVIQVSYVHGLDLISQNRLATSGKSFYHVDGLGSTKLLTNASGIVTDSYIYDAFGQLIGQVGSTGNVYLFAGEQRDLSTGLDYLRARYLDTSVGRFVSADPFEGSLGDPFSLHNYQYAHANPVVNIDPTGQFSILGVAAGFATNTLSSFRFDSIKLAQAGFTLAVIKSVIEPGIKFRYQGALAISENLDVGFETYSFGNQLIASGADLISLGNNSLGLARSLIGFSRVILAPPPVIRRTFGISVSNSVAFTQINTLQGTTRTVLRTATKLRFSSQVVRADIVQVGRQIGQLSASLSRVIRSVIGS